MTECQNQNPTLTAPLPGIRSRARALLEGGRTIDQICSATGLGRGDVVKVAVGQGWSIDSATGLAVVTRRALNHHNDSQTTHGQHSMTDHQPQQCHLSGALSVQRGTPILQAFAPIGTIVRHTAVDTYDPQTTSGYQRSLSTARIPKVAAYYELGGRMVNAIMMNIRDYDFANVSVTVANGGDDAYKRAIVEHGNWMGVGEITFERGVRLWIYDGQHRRGALAHLLKHYEEDFADFPVPVGITLGLSADQETREFYEVNTNVVNVQTDLAWTLLTGLAMHDAELRASLETNGKRWITRGSEVVAVLMGMEGPWMGRFQLANSRKHKGDGATIRKAQFIRSLRPVLEAPVFKVASTDDIASVINAYWIGISRVLPEAFAGDPADYVIQKGIGVSTLHQVLPEAAEIARSKGNKLADPAAYQDVMMGLKTLSGHAIINGKQVPCEGAKFWRSQSAATGFSGNTGRHRLAQLLQNIMPTPDNISELI